MSHISFINYINKGDVFHIQKIKVCTLGDGNAHNTDQVDVRFLNKVRYNGFYSPIISIE